MNDQIVLGYSRVSSEEQAAHGISIEAQRDILNGYAAMTSQQIRIYEDAGFSGKNTSRPALQQLLSDCRSGSVSAVVVWKLDRLSRSLRDTLTIIEDVFQPRNITLVSVTESIDTSTPSGRMMLNLLASFAQLEREQDSDRVVMAHKHLARDCKYLGGHVPLGYCIDAEKHYQLDPVSAPVVRRVFDMYLARAGYTPILDYLNSFTFPGTRKTSFKKSDLNNLLKNEIYAGVYIRRLGADPRHRITSPETIRVPGGVPAILSPEEWQRVCALREQAAVHASSRAGSVRVYPLSGIVFCAVCGSLMRVNYGGKTRSGHVERYYECRNRCTTAPRLEHIEQAVSDACRIISQDEKTFREAVALVNSFSDAADQDRAADAAAYRHSIIQLSKRSQQIVSFIATQGAQAPAALMDELRSIDDQKAKLQAKIEALSVPVARYDADETLAALRAAGQIKNCPPEQQRELIQKAVYKVLVSEDDYKILFLWHKCGGDEPPQYLCHKIPRITRSSRRLQAGRQDSSQSTK